MSGVRNKNESQLAFTLIELLVVISIIGLLLSFTLIFVQNARQKARIAKARDDIASTIKAADFVYQNYGYYPSDSNVAVVCPKNIVIDSASNTTFGKFVSACTDPFGTPYMWNNFCQNGHVRDADGSDPTCLPYSETGPGAIGMLSAGPNRVAEGCNNDDICFGFRGYPIHEWNGSVGGGGGSGPAPTAVATCVDVTSACSGFSDSPTCIARNGCTWSADTCSGSFTIDCATLSDSSSCSAATGCTWTGSSCSGSPPSCSSYGSSGTCTANGCTWTAASSCLGAAVACSSILVKATCNSQKNCNWTGNPKTCQGNHPACSTYNTSNKCTKELSCSWGGVGCSGSPTACSSYGSSGACTGAGCAWNAAACSGTSNGNCTALSTQPACTAQTGCSWNAAACSGTAASCATLTDRTSCLFQSGCNWQ